MTFRQWLNLEETTLYHGTQGTFDTLEPRKARFGTGISFTTNPDIARNYAIGKYKGGKTTGTPTVRQVVYHGNSFNFQDPVPDSTVRSINKRLNSFLDEFTPDKRILILKGLNGDWRTTGERFLKQIHHSFAKRGTEAECKLAKSRNTGLSVCEKHTMFDRLTDFLNEILLEIGYDSICYNDTNDEIDHKCYFIINKDKIRERKL
jgi:hypothetical protein